MMTDYTNFRVLVDLPTERPALGFKTTAQGLASLIRYSEPRFTIGIFGSWGSGKTTLMEAIKNELKALKIVTVDFSAWRYEKEEHLIVPLLDTIRQGLVDWADNVANVSDQATDKTRERRKALSDAALKTASTVGKVMASLLAGVSFKVGLPGALELAYDANKALSKGKELGKEKDVQHDNGQGANEKKEVHGTGFSEQRSDPRLAQSFYHVCFTALAESFREFAKLTGGTRIVVFVDDLDRCLPSGALEVLESMKLFFDLRGFVFVVGLDREVVERCIDSRYTLRRDIEDAQDVKRKGSERLIRGSDYLKKIFQVPFSLAPIALDQIDDLVESLSRDSRLSQEQVDDLRGRVRPHLAFLVSGLSINPREVKRYINAYTLQMKIKANLEPEAVLALQTIAFRQDCEKLADAVAAYGLEFTTALRALFEGDSDALADFELERTDISEDVRSYLGPGGPGRILLQVDNLDDYIYAGEATRSSLGGVYVDLLRAYRELRSAVIRALGAEEVGSLDAAYSDAASQFSRVSHLLAEMAGPDFKEAIFPLIESLREWFETKDRGVWFDLHKALESDVDENQAQVLKKRAKEDADRHMNSLRAALRQIRRRANLGGAEAF
jgi:hypothetical protein